LSKQPCPVGTDRAGLFAQDRQLRYNGRQQMNARLPICVSITGRIFGIYHLSELTDEFTD
jgi:hypothetical protein